MMSRMNYISVSLLLLALLFLPFSYVSAMHHEKPVTPYGDFCPKCSKYGTCNSAMSHEDAKKAVIDYYHKKGYSVELVKKNGRFIRVKIIKEKKVVDVVIFDRKTGRIRSIY